MNPTEQNKEAPGPVYEPEADALALLKPETARRLGVLPLRARCGVLFAAVAEGRGADAADSLSHLLGMPVEPRPVNRETLREILERCYGPAGPATEKKRAELKKDGPAHPIQFVLPGAAANETEHTPLSRNIQRILAEAFRQRASDIHFEPMEKFLRVRFRVDGVLDETERLPRALQSAVITRLKLMARLDIAEKRRPQDGRAQLQTARGGLDLRVSCIPTIHGESLVLRILDKEGPGLSLSGLGLFPDDEKTAGELLQLADGLILSAGPTGAGKTTTQYACLQKLNRPRRKIITVEDPVEYRLAGLTQTAARPRAGLTFAAALRAIMRQSPDVIMIGEIRDWETARAAAQAALTGHLVFSTLHAHDAPGTVTRLLDMGIPPFLAAAALRGVIAQRLVRRVCPNCRTPRQPDPRDLMALELKEADLPAEGLMAGAGCSACHQRGFLGRAGLFEILRVNETLADCFGSRHLPRELRREARRHGWRPLREDGVRKALAGWTTLREVITATS